MIWKVKGVQQVVVCMYVTVVFTCSLSFTLTILSLTCLVVSLYYSLAVEDYAMWELRGKGSPSLCQTCLLLHSTHINTCYEMFLLLTVPTIVWPEVHTNSTAG